MFSTIREFWLKWRLRVANEKILSNTRDRKVLVKVHQGQVAKAERIKSKLSAAAKS